MEKKPYHHGDLKKDLIENGIKIINTEGISALTMRKVAEMCHVSATAAYKHFKNKEDLMEAIRSDIAKDFSAYLESCLTNSDPRMQMLEIGIGYVKYMLAHKEYYYLMFCSELNIEVTFENGDFSYPEDSPFRVFYESAEVCISPHVPDPVLRHNKILMMWSEVHGIAGLLCNHVLKTTEDVDKLVANMLLSVSNQIC